MDDDSDVFGMDSVVFKDSKPAAKKTEQPRKATIGANKKNAAVAKKSEWSDDQPKQMSAQERIAAMKARLAGIKAEEEEEPTQKNKKAPAKTSNNSANRQLVRFSEAAGADDEELYFEDEYDLPKSQQQQPPPPKKKPEAASRPPPPSSNVPKKGKDLDDDFMLDEEDVPEVDTRIRSTMALEKHWSEVEEKRKREEAQRKRNLKEKQAELQNEEQRLLLELQEKKRRDEELRRRQAEEDLRRAAEDWKKKEEDKRKKFEAKIKAKDLQLQRLEEARKKREDMKKKLTDEEERRRREYEAEMARLTTEENDLIKKIQEEEDSKRQAIAEEDRRRVEENEQRQKQEEERKRREAEEEMRLLEEEEKQLLKREQEIERELEEKRRMREEKLREIQSALKKDEPPAAAAPTLDPEEILSFCLQVPASARRIKGTMYHGIFTGQQATDIMVQWSGTRRDAVRSGQKLLDAGVFWPLDGPMTLEDSDRMYNLEDSNEFVQRARQQLEEESNYSAPAPVATPAKHSSVKTASASASAAPAPARVKSVQTPPPASAQKKSAQEPIAELRVLDDAGQQLPKYEFLLFAGETEIGRRSDNGISLPVLSVSKRHAKIDVGADGRVSVTDLGSSNKTRLFASGSSSGSAVVLKPNEAYPVSSGAEFLFGEIRCLLTIFSESQARESAYEFDYDNVEADLGGPPNKELPPAMANTLDRFSVAPPIDAAPLPPGSAAPLPPRSVVGPKRTNNRK